MELLYIWIDGFRNFQNIGFNISDTFDIEYNRETGLLSINEARKSSNVFGDNITNITGIIGKNSTGKSNLLELVSLILKSKKNTLTFDFIALFNSDYMRDSQMFIYSNIHSEIKTNSSFGLINNSDEFNHLNVAYFSNIQDDRELNIPRSVINLTPSKSLPKRKSDMLNQFKFLLTEDFLGVDLESPKNLIISTITKTSYNRDKEYMSNFDNDALQVISGKFKNALKTSNPIKHFIYSFTFSLFSYIIVTAVNEIKNRRKDLFEVNPDYSNLNELFTKSFKDVANLDMKDLIEAIKEFIGLVFYEFTTLGSLNKKDAMSLLDFDRAIEYLHPRLIKEGKYNQARSYYLIDFNSENKRILKEYLSIFNQNQIIELSWGGISSGHKAFLNVFSQFNSVIKKINNKPNVLILIDEGDLYMHPVWQQEFLNRILNYLKSNYKADIQMIMTSHSPFLVSDLPRQNLIYLDRTEEYMCKVIPIKESEDETFGANLLDLYSNSFFLSGGTISKFAYGKIKEVVEKLKRKDLSKQDFDSMNGIISIIGDDVIKLKLKKMITDAENRN
ncbi:AAA family ATPase [Plebeiibacterium sediminum]|uniref:ATP-binding protein n=1 Tax=Plebeiibacterium sediminum TaxID=2992112 RepID=A0AAE3M9C0_9BACT|nr:AAA family ATPase [Plebeiobacterium sediminum]MCW3789656.1 ATP-binding protein [Plebeiobacterium sediminum]